jgi:hypothetical protein
MYLIAVSLLFEGAQTTVDRSGLQMHSLLFLYRSIPDVA